MEDGKRILAVIPARGGSKGLPRKNILNCAGKPLLAWTVEAAQKSTYVDRVLVSTESQEIADVAETCGAWVPFLRPAALAQDESTLEQVVKDIIDKLQGSYEFDYVMALQPTSPLRTSLHIDQAVEKFFAEKKSDADTLISVQKIGSKILWALGEKSETGYLYSHFDKSLSSARRQMLPECFTPNGAIYLAKVKGFDRFYGERTLSYLMDDVASMDVDYQEDLDCAANLLATQSDM